MADKIIAVLGSTGAQAGGLVRAILADKGGGFAVRAITRKPDSDKGKALAKAGAEVVAADLDDVESLTRAFTGAYGVYGLTNFWEHFSGDKELQQGRNIAAAARNAGVKHVIWSTFEDTRDRLPLSDNRMPTLQGKYKVAHFDAKAEANKAFTEGGVPTTFLYTSFYWENFIAFGAGPKKGEDGKYALTLPLRDKKMPGIGVEDIGPAAYAIFKRGNEFIDKTVGIAGEHLTGAQMAASLGKALGIEVGYNDVPADVYRSFGFPGADDMGNMLQYKADFEAEYCGIRPIAFTRELHPGLQTFDQWLAKHAKQIPLD
jgi:uncharacterized protein YbjT (DUF2867 family)